MDEGVLVVRGKEERSTSGIRDAEGLAQVIRRLAIEAHEIVNCPDAGIGELINLCRQFEELLREAGGHCSQPAELENWLRNAYFAIETKLRSCLGPGRGLLAS